MNMTYDEYIEYLNHLFLQRMSDSEYIAFILQSQIWEKCNA